MSTEKPKSRTSRMAQVEAAEPPPAMTKSYSLAMHASRCPAFIAARGRGRKASVRGEEFPAVAAAPPAHRQPGEHSEGEGDEDEDGKLCRIGAIAAEGDFVHDPAGVEGEEAGDDEG